MSSNHQRNSLLITRMKGGWSFSIQLLGHRSQAHQAYKKLLMDHDKMPFHINRENNNPSILIMIYICILIKHSCIEEPLNIHFPPYSTTNCLMTQPIRLQGLPPDHSIASIQICVNTMFSILSITIISYAPWTTVYGSMWLGNKADTRHEISYTICPTAF